MEALALLPVGQRSARGDNSSDGPLSFQALLCKVNPRVHATADLQGVRDAVSRPGVLGLCLGWCLGFGFEFGLKKNLVARFRQEPIPELDPKNTTAVE